MVVWEPIALSQANQTCVYWGHYLGACNRPFGSQAFGLFLFDVLVSVAISASTVSKTVASFNRKQVVELARLCSDPGHTDMTRVALRLWRKTAGDTWGKKYWPVKAYVSYSDSTRHAGDIYRFDGWTKVAETKGSTGGGTYSTKKLATPKGLWIYRVQG